MKLYHLSSGPLRVNTYFLVNEETRDAVIIDGGENYRLIKRTEEQCGVRIRYHLLTHAHFDHAGNAAQLQADGVKTYLSALDALKLNDEGSLSLRFGRRFNSFTPDGLLKDGQELCLCGIGIEVIATAGHTDGSLTFKTDGMLFTGDTLFYESVGRTDFPTGDRAEIIRSVQKLFALDGDYAVYPGHEEFTTLSHERKYNTFGDVEV